MTAAVEPDVGPRPAAEVVRYGSAMLRRFGWFYSLLGLGHVLGRVRFEDHSAEQIRAAAERGPVVYVLDRRSTIDHLALNTVINQRRLPLSCWANGVTSFWWQPVVDAWRDVARRVQERLRRGTPPDPVTSGWLARSVANGIPITIFVDTAPSLGNIVVGDFASDPLRAILDAQHLCDRPIQLVPVLVVWDRAPEARPGPLKAFMDGIREAPGFFGQVWRAWWSSDGAFIQVGVPIDLKEFAERFDEPRRAKALRLALRRFLHREATLVRGPRVLPYNVLKRIVLDNPPMRDLARREAEAQGKDPERVRAQMEKEYDKIAAHFRWWVIRLLDVLLKPLWTRIYAGVDVRTEDMDRIRGAMRGGTAILVPSHKSHFDYLLISWVFYAHDLIVPHVIAGMNLAIWPVSIFLRGAGGFFIKRSFAGDRVFPAIFSRYLRELVRQGHPVEFFIEGGRTRSGKLMPPKLGVLGMVLESAEVRRSGQDVALLPVSLAYEQVAEEAAYARELGGEAKTAESVGELVKARSVLWRRYGRVYMRVGEPVPCAAIVEGPPRWSERSRREQKEVLQEVGERLMYRIGLVTVVLPTSIVALALLAHHRRGIPNAELLARIDRFRAFLQRANTLPAESLRHASQGIHEAIGRFLRSKLVEGLDNAGDRVWAVVVAQRITLDFHKNQILHFFAPAMYAAAAIRALPDGPFAAEDARDGFLYLTWALRREFVVDPDRPASELLAEGLSALVAHGALAFDGVDQRYRVAEPGRIGEIHALLRSLLEGYLFAVEALPEAVIETSLRDLPRALQVLGERDGRGIATRPESLSLVTLQNVVSALREERTVDEADDKLTVSAALREHHRARLRPMVL